MQCTLCATWFRSIGFGLKHGHGRSESIHSVGKAQLLHEIKRIDAPNYFAFALLMLPYAADAQDNDDYPRTAPGDLPMHQAACANESSDDEDALPQPGAAKQAPHCPNNGLAAGLQMTAEEQLRFKALFETVCCLILDLNSWFEM